jgi:hypothetical protein
MLVLILFLLIVSIGSIVYSIINKEYFETVSSTIFTMVLCFLSYTIINNFKNIIIDNKINKIIFRYGLMPFIKIKKIDFDRIEEISINNIQDTVPYFHQIKEKTYSVDLIDKEQYSYKIYQSEVYNEELIDFANKIGKIINKDINDNNAIEGFKNIYKKNVI